MFLPNIKLETAFKPLLLGGEIIILSYNGTTGVGKCFNPLTEKTELTPNALYYGLPGIALLNLFHGHLSLGDRVDRGIHRTKRSSPQHNTLPWRR